MNFSEKIQRSTIFIQNVPRGRKKWQKRSFRTIGRWEFESSGYVITFLYFISIRSKALAITKQWYNRWWSISILTIKWGASSWWSFRRNSAWGSIETTTIEKTHSTLLYSKITKIKGSNKKWTQKWFQC